MPSPAHVAFLFPGQGSQSLGMFRAFLEDTSAAGQAVRESLQASSDALDQDLIALGETGPAEAQSLTTNTQPLMLAGGLAFWQAYLAAGGAAPEWAAGHSLGEFSALTAAGTFSAGEALRTVRLRAAAMQEAVPVGVGGMAAVLGLTGQQVADYCQSQTRPDAALEAVNFNAPDQTVIAGHLTALASAVEGLKAIGAKRVLPLPVSAPFHSSLMAPAAQALGQHLEGLALQPPRLRVLHNVDVAEHASAEAIRTVLTQQAMAPVRWVETIQRLRAEGVTHFVECGPGKVLSGLLRKIDPEAISLHIADPASLAHTLESLQS